MDTYSERDPETGCTGVEVVRGRVTVLGPEGTTLGEMGLYLRNKHRGGSVVGKAFRRGRMGPISVCGVYIGVVRGRGMGERHRNTVTSVGREYSVCTRYTSE